jgi:hypothetical protein
MEIEFVYSLFLFGGEMGLLISVPCASLSAGLALSLLAAVCVCGVQIIPHENHFT